MATCHCMGPQNGEPLCPCQMRAVANVAAIVATFGAVLRCAGPCRGNPLGSACLYEGCPGAAESTEAS